MLCRTCSKGAVRRKDKRTPCSAAARSLARFLLLLVLVVSVRIARSQTVGTFVPTGSMTTPRRGHTATLLADGRVLIAGGQSTSTFEAPPVDTTEMYDPSTGTFAPGNRMTIGRAGHTATLLADGRVLIVGGNRDHPASAEIYDPSAGTFSPTEPMTAPIPVGTWTGIGNQIAPGSGAVLLQDGTVLVLGDRRAQIYDPLTDTFSLAGEYAMDVPLVFSTIPLADGRVLVVGNSGCCANSPRADLYDPGSRAFTPTSDVPVSWWLDYSANLLLNGRVLIAGSSILGIGGADLGALLYDPLTGNYIPTGELTSYRDLSVATLLPDGTVLLSGGGNGDFGCGTSSAEIYNPTTARFTGTGRMTIPRVFHTATVLLDGRVLVAGGACIDTTASAEIYSPPMPTPPPVLLSQPSGLAAILHAGTDRVVSPDDPAVP